MINSCSLLRSINRLIVVFMLFVLYSFSREDFPLFHIEFKIRKFRIDLVEVYELRTKEYVFLFFKH